MFGRLRAIEAIFMDLGHLCILTYDALLQPRLCGVKAHDVFYCILFLFIIWVMLSLELPENTADESVVVVAQFEPRHEAVSVFQP